MAPGEHKAAAGRFSWLTESALTLSVNFDFSDFDLSIITARDLPTGEMRMIDRPSRCFMCLITGLGNPQRRNAAAEKNQ